MTDRFGEYLAGFIQVAAGVEHAVDLDAVLRPLFDLVEIVLVREKRVVGFFIGQVAHRLKSGPQRSCQPRGCFLGYFLSRIALAHRSISDGEREITSRQLGLWSNNSIAFWSSAT
jgi:hypothetical protein